MRFAQQQVEQYLDHLEEPGAMSVFPRLRGSPAPDSLRQLEILQTAQRASERSTEIVGRAFCSAAH